MLPHYFVDATGVIALSFNVSGLAGPSDRKLRSTTGWASAIWALNNFLIGAHSAAALSVLSVGRQASASALQGSPRHIRALVFSAIVALTALIAALTWSGLATVCTAAGSLTATWAMFYLRGVALRLAMLAVAALWMVNAVVYDSWWQVIANLLAAGAAVIGAWRTRAEH